MEKMILIYCGLIGVIILSMLCLLIYDAGKNEPETDNITAHDKWMLSGTVLIVIMIMHMNWMAFHFKRSQEAAITGLAAFSLGVFLFLLYAVRALFSKRKSHGGKLVTLRGSDGRILKWTVFTEGDNPVEAVPHGQDGKMVS